MVNLRWFVVWSKVRSLSDFCIIFYFQTGRKFCCSGKMTSGHKQFSRILLVFLWTAIIGGEFYDFIVFVRTYLSIESELKWY